MKVRSNMSTSNIFTCLIDNFIYCPIVSASQAPLELILLHNSFLFVVFIERIKLHNKWASINYVLKKNTLEWCFCIKNHSFIIFKSRKIPRIKKILYKDCNQLWNWIVPMVSMKHRLKFVVLMLLSSSSNHSK